jgi:hypothetical protein
MTDETRTIPEGSFPEEAFVLVQRDFDDLHEQYCTDRQCVALRHVWLEREGISLCAPCDIDAALTLSYAEGILYVRCVVRYELVAQIAVARTHPNGLTESARLFRRQEREWLAQQGS